MADTIYRKTVQYRNSRNLLLHWQGMLWFLFVSAVALNIEFLALRPIRKIPSDLLYVSEPDPSMFGNPPNPSSPHWTNKNWLKSRFHFSFAEYHNEHNSNFGSLRVLNDDLVQPERGFGTHPHKNMEIVTYVVHGHLTHQDSMGVKETLSKGSVQFMTAGTGIYHSEHNLHATESLRIIQLWITPRAQNLPPKYGSVSGSESSRESRSNKWQHLVTDVQNNDPNIAVKINQDANIYVSELKKTESVIFKLESNRQAYLLCIEGQAHFSEVDEDKKNNNYDELNQYDAAEIKGPYTFKTEANTDSLLLIVEMQKTSDTRF